MLIITSPTTYLYHYVILTPNGDGYNDHFQPFEYIPNNSILRPDSSFMIVEDTCGNIYYDSKYSAVGRVYPAPIYATWNGIFAPDSASYYLTPKVTSEGFYNFTYITWKDGIITNPYLSGRIELTRP